MLAFPAYRGYFEAVRAVYLQLSVAPPLDFFRSVVGEGGGGESWGGGGGGGGGGGEEIWEGESSQNLSLKTSSYTQHLTSRGSKNTADLSEKIENFYSHP